MRAALHASVHFVAHDRTPHDRDRPPLVVFGALTVNGNHATLGIETLRGPLCGEGRTLVLVRADGRWRVSASSDPDWVS